MKDYQLKALLQVVDAGSIRAAARALGVSQPAVTKAIRELEAEVDAPLVHRSSRGVELTECGRQLTIRARLVQAQLAMARQDIRQLQGGQQASVAVSVTPVVFMGALPEVLREFQRAMPQAQVRLFEGLMPLALPQLREGFVDFAVAAAVEDSLDSDLELEPIAPIPMMVACRPGHPLAGATTWEALVDAEWLVHRAPGSHHTVLFERFVRQGLPVPQRLIEANTFRRVVEPDDPQRPAADAARAVPVHRALLPPDRARTPAHGAARAHAGHPEAQGLATVAGGRQAGHAVPAVLQVSGSAGACRSASAV